MNICTRRGGVCERCDGTRLVSVDDVGAMGEHETRVVPCPDCDDEDIDGDDERDERVRDSDDEAEARARWRGWFT